MQVEAIKVEDGFLIPFNQVFEKIKENKILIEVQIIENNKLEEGYAILDELVGFCESNRTDASVKHDSIIYLQPSPLAATPFARLNNPPSQTKAASQPPSKLESSER